MEVLSALQFLELNLIPEAWVDAVWDLEFTERHPLDEPLEEALSSTGDDAFRNLYQCLLAHHDQHQAAHTTTASQSLWALLLENEVSVKSLVAALSFFVLAGKAKAASVGQRVKGLQAASLYLLLLPIPGSIANQVVHEVFLDTCLDMTSHCWPQDSGKKRKKDHKSSQADSKRSKPQRKDNPEMEVDEDEENEDEPHFTGQDLMKIREAVVLLVQSILRLLQKFPLKNNPQSATNCSQIFSKLLYFEPVVGELSFEAELDLSKLRSVPEMAFYGLKLLCSPKHGDQTKSLRRVFHRLLYVILMMNKVDRGKPTLLALNQSVLATRDQAIRFVCHMLDELKELALPFLHILLQHFCFQMVEKSEYRTRGAQTVGMLTSQMASTDYACFIKWLLNFSRHSKMVSRLFSVDVVMVLLEQQERRVEDCEDPELHCFLSHKFLIQNLLFPRRMDLSPTVQGHAFASLAQCLELHSLNATRAVHDLFSTGSSLMYHEGETTEGTVSSQQKTYRTLSFRTVEITSNISSTCDAKENLALLLRRVQDPKINVRKSSLQALKGLLKHDVIPVVWENLAVLAERCRDPSVSVKKAALQSLGELLAVKPDCSVVQKAWLQGVLPALVDSETSVQERALEALDQVLLSNIKPFSAGRHLDASQQLTWDLLDLLCTECQNLSRYFSRAFTIWSKQNKFSQTFVTNLISHTEADHAAGAWLLLSKVATSSPRMPYGKILDAWDAMMGSKAMSVTTCCHILSVMGDIADHLNQDTKDRIVDDLMSWLKSFTLSLEVISAAVETLHQLGSSDDITQTQAFLNQCCGELVSVCEAYLSTIMLSEHGTNNLNVELMVKHLHTLGVASLQCPAKVSKKTFLLVESVLTTHPNTLPGCQEELPASLPLSQFRPNALPTRVRAQGVLTLGKLCLQHEELVQKYLPVFARELEVGAEVAVRNNVVIIMCDLCVRYTNIVDHYVPNISACLRDPEHIIRQQTLIMLTNLLQEEFVKWKGSLFFRFMVALVDPVPAIASLCEYCLRHLLLKKNPEMFSQHFIECIFHFNSYTKHKTYNKFPQSQREKVEFPLKGAEQRDKRFRIYRFLLEHFTDAQRFNVSMKINQNVLACFADQELPLDADGAEILSETFNILSLKEMKLQAMTSPAGGAAGEEKEEEQVDTMAKAVLQAAHKKVVSQVQKKAFVENVVPLIISLKNLLEQHRSPVLRDLMSYLQVTMQDYRSEVKDFFSGDEQLAAEVEFALKAAETQREMEDKMEDCCLAGDARTPTVQVSVPGFTSPPRQNPSPQRLTHSSRFILEEQSKSMNRTGRSKAADKIPVFSTPKGSNVSLSFAGVSAIFSDQPSVLDQEPSVFHVVLPEQQLQSAEPRRWNVLSPLRQNRKSSAKV